MFDLWRFGNFLGNFVKFLALYPNHTEVHLATFNKKRIIPSRAKHNYLARLPDLAFEVWRFASDSFVVEHFQTFLIIILCSLWFTLTSFFVQISTIFVEKDLQRFLALYLKGKTSICKQILLFNSLINIKTYFINIFHMYMY